MTWLFAYAFWFVLGGGVATALRLLVVRSIMKSAARRGQFLHAFYRDAHHVRALCPHCGSNCSEPRFVEVCENCEQKL